MPKTLVQKIVVGVIALAALWLLTSRPWVQPIQTVQGIPDAYSTLTLHPGWTSNTSAKVVEDLAADSAGNIWVATGGGVVRWNPATNVFAHFTTLDGLASNNIHDIAIAPNGDIWLASQGGGLSHFDGKTWRAYTQQSGLPTNWINAVAVTADGDVWLGTSDQGLCRFDGRQCSFYTKAAGLPNNRIDQLAVAPDGTLWAASSVSSKNEEGGVAHFDGQRWHTYPRSSFFNRLIVTPDNVVWAGTLYDGLLRLEGEQWVRYGIKQTRDELNDVWALAAASDGTLWAGRRDTIEVSRDGEQWTVAAYDHDLPVPRLATTLLPMPDGTVWFGTYDDGLYKFSGQPDQLNDSQKWTHLVIPNDLPHHNVRAIDFETNGTAWLATEGGLAKYDGQAWSTHNIDAFRMEQDYWSIAVAPDSTVWVGTRTVGILRINGQSWQIYGPRDGLVGEFYHYAAAITPDGRVWFGSGDGIDFYTNGKWTAIHASDVLDDVQAIALAPDNTLWFGKWRGGVSRLNQSTGMWTTYTTADGLIDGWIHAITVDAHNVVWVGTEHGVSRFDGQQWQNYTVENGLAENDVQAMAVAPDGAIWFGTAHSGVSRFDGKDWTHYTTADGLISNGIHAIRFAPDGAIWFATDGGVSRYCPLDNSNCK